MATPLRSSLMGKLIYLLNTSLDGFIETPDRRLDWTTIDEELHGWFNDQMRALDATLYGRRIYELMAAYWPTAEQDPGVTDVEREFARIWDPLPKIVFSRTLERVEHNSRLVRGDVGTVLDGVRREFGGDLGVAGPDLAGQFVRRGLVDEYRLVTHPVVLGAGTPFWPALERPLRLRLREWHTFSSGVELRSYTPA
ncbi:MAG TPA: dihydrofolate reductase family protein [Candidatus Limnocylindria bacterium]|nr:dihydrofolate reductase family protein [Candidatus Limnocylindria bacterium]